MAVRLTDLTADALTGTVRCASSCRCVEFASTAPRSHEDVPSSLPQPKLNPGAPPLAGVAFSRMVASGTFPPVAQALTVHWTECPRSLLACERATSTHRLTGAACGTVLAPLSELLLVGVGVGVLVAVDVGAAVGAGCDVRVPVGTGVADAVSFDVVGVADGVTAGLETTVRVGASLAPEEVAPDEAELAAVLVVVVDEGLVVVATGADVVGDGVGAVGVGVGVCVVGVADGVGLGDAADSCTGSHDSLLDVVAAFAAVMPAAAARVTPEAAVSRTLPAINVTVAGRACVKRMKSPTSAARYCCGTTYSVWNGFMSGSSPARRDTHFVEHQTPCGTLPALLPGRRR